MSLFFSNKVVRLLLSISVSAWMAGGCLVGCTGVMGAEPAQNNVVEHGASCHAKPAPESAATHLSGPRGMMKDCPLGVNATAAISKSSTYSPEPARAPVAALPSFEKQTLYTENPQTVPFLHNRGSTHLKCCVFLI